MGNWAEAERLLDEWEAFGDTDLVMSANYEYCRALVAAGRGDPGEANRWADVAIAQARSAGNRWDEFFALWARGTAALVERDAERAVTALRTVWAHFQREVVWDPGVFPIASDLVEALVDIGEGDEAVAVVERLRALAEDQEHPWGLVTARRCAAVVELTEAWSNAAAASLESAAGDYGAMGLRVDRARSLLLLGRAARRAKKWAVARRALEQAAQAFDEMGSPGWAAEARGELLRIGGRHTTPAGDLTPAEHRVVALAAEGLSNKQISRRLSVTVNTVEVHLSRAYAKLGVRSRVQLAAALAPSMPPVNR
jgi:DNA-binding CsgD family transcriptional regulator